MKEDETPLSSLVGERGIKTTKDFADFMGALMADLVAGRVDSEVAKAACLAGDKILKVAEMQLKIRDYKADTPLGRDDTALIADKTGQP